MLQNNEAKANQFKNYVDIQQVSFENHLFWSYFLSTNYPCAYLEDADRQLCDLVEEVMPIDVAWSNAFTHYYDGVMEENDGYLDEPTTITAPISDTEILEIEFHPGDTIYYINKEEIGCTGPHWNLWNVPYHKLNSLLSLEHGSVLFLLLLPMAVVEPDEIADLKPILEKQFQAFGFSKEAALQAADCLISGIVKRDLGISEEHTCIHKNPN